MRGVTKAFPGMRAGIAGTAGDATHEAAQPTGGSVAATTGGD
jgi:hypothetical protein